MRELAQLGGCVLSMIERLGHESGRGVGVLGKGPARQLQRDDRVHEALLRPVVQIANHPPPLVGAPPSRPPDELC